MYVGDPVDVRLEDGVWVTCEIVALEEGSLQVLVLGSRREIRRFDLSCSADVQRLARVGTHTSGEVPGGAALNGHHNVSVGLGTDFLAPFLAGKTFSQLTEKAATVRAGDRVTVMLPLDEFGSLQLARGVVLEKAPSARQVLVRIVSDGGLQNEMWLDAEKVERGE